MTNLRKKSCLILIRKTTPSQRKSKAIYKCFCGKEFEATISNVKSGNTTSCGCTKRKHGFWNHPLYRIWQTMKARCYNPKAINYFLYGGRGVRVCEQWIHSPEAFITWALNNGWKSGMQIDKDAFGDNKIYSPNTCVISTPKNNSNNRRNNNKITHNGVTKTIQQWSDDVGIGWCTIKARLNRGWSVDRALTQKVNYKITQDVTN